MLIEIISEWRELMQHWMHRITPLAICLFVALNTQAQNNPIEKSSDYHINTKINQPDSQFAQISKEAVQRRIAIADRANTVFTLFASELALGSGQASTALVTHESIWEKSHDPAVAARAVEMALELGAVPQAKTILQQWQTLEPKNSSIIMQRLAWQVALAEDNFPEVIKDIESVLNNANDYQLRRLFLLLAQASLKQKAIPQEIYPIIHQEAQKYKNMPEAMIADALYSSFSNHDVKAIEALQQLAILDSEAQTGTQLTLILIGKFQPEILNRFFNPEQFASLPAMWQSWYIEFLLNKKQLAYAYQLLQPSLIINHSPELYLQAVFLSINQKENDKKILNYARQAYNLGNVNQKNKVALMLSTYMEEHNELIQARQWAEKINSPEYSFDQAIILATIEQQDKNWSAAQKWLNKASREQKAGVFFNQDNLFRLQIIQANETLSPQQYLHKLNLWLADAKAKKNQEFIEQLIFLRGMVYVEKLHQPEAAVKEFRHYLELRPDEIQGLNSLGYTLLSLPKQHWQEAQQLLEKAYAIDSQAAYINDSLGWAYYLNGDHARALPLLQYAYAHYPDIEVAGHLGAALWQMGKKDEALQIWAQGWAKKDNANNKQSFLQILKRFNIDPAKLPEVQSTQSGIDESHEYQE